MHELTVPRERLLEHAEDYAARAKKPWSPIRVEQVDDIIFYAALGAIIGGLLLGLLESFGAGYVSSTYKDAIAFVVILAVLFVAPQGLVGRRTVERV